MAFDKDRVLSLQLVGGRVLIVIIIAIIITNLSLIASILWSSKLRCRLRNLAICCLSASDLLLGLFGASLIADRYIRNDWVHGCVTQLVMFVFMNHSQEFVATWYIVLLNIDYIMRLFNINTTVLSSPVKTLLYVVLLILPWAAMCAVVIPIYSFRIHPNVREMWRPDFCPPIIPYSPFATMTTLGFFVPAAIIILTSVVMVVVHIIQKMKLGESNMAANFIGIRDSPTETLSCTVEHPMCFIIPGLLTVALHLPLSIFHLTPGVWNNYERGLTLWIVLLIIRVSKAMLVPLSWLTIPDIRAEVKNSFTCTCCTRQASGEGNGHATYRRFVDDQTTHNDDPVVTISCR
ncbi:uncharacterized protein [Haliotis cracherodii]|uniref:uncharacterized protein isoform X1 n=1 Tax=Haliotis cracherodii TaxID=6455 RepID=UPI0039EA0A25